MDTVLKIVSFALIPASVLVAASILTLVRAPGPPLRSALMHFAGGVVFAVLAIELLPVLIHDKSALVTGVGFAAGTLTMLAIRKVTETSGIASTSTQPALPKVSGSLLFAAGIDLVIDGLMLGIGFAAGAKEGILLTIGLALELAALGVVAMLGLGQSQGGRGWSLLKVGGLALLFVASAGVGGAALQLITGVALVGVLAFGVAALLFLVTEELLREAHEVPETPWLTSAFFAGFLLLMLLELVQ